MHKIPFLLLVLAVWGCQPKTPAPSPTRPVELWSTSADRTHLLDSTTLDFAKGQDDRLPIVQIDTAQQFQTVDGFGYTLTGGSAFLLHQMGPTERAALLQEFFGKKANSIGVSYLRLSMGASDLDAEVFQLRRPPGGTDRPGAAAFQFVQRHAVPAPGAERNPGDQSKHQTNGFTLESAGVDENQR